MKQVVDDDVDFAFAELGGFLDQVLVVGWADDVACDGDGGAASFVDGVGDGLGLDCVEVSNAEGIGNVRRYLPASISATTIFAPQL